MLVEPPEGFLGEEEAGFFFVGLGGREPMSSDLIVCFEAVAGLVGFEGDFLVAPEGGGLGGGDEAVSGEFRNGGISMGEPRLRSRGTGSREVWGLMSISASEWVEDIASSL